jgi:hypothetical protein
MTYKVLTSGAITTAGNYDLGRWTGGVGTFTVQASSWGGATAKLQVSFDDGVTYIDAGTYTTFTANGVGVFECGDCKVRVNTSGGTMTAGVAKVMDNVPSGGL